MQTSRTNLYALIDWIYSLPQETEKTQEQDELVVDRTKTATYKILFNSSNNLYERLKSFLIKTSIKDTKIRINPNDRADLVSDFLVFIVDKDKLKNYENTELNFNAVYWHFLQFLTRDKYTGGQDLHRRTVEGVRTQSEQMKVKKGIDTKTYSAPETHKAFSRKNEDGDIERDYVSNEQTPEDLTIRSTTVNAMGNKVLKLFKSEYGPQWKEMYDIYQNKLNETYDSMAEWSKVEGISLPTLKNRWSNIQDLMKKRGIEFFQTEPSKQDNIRMINKWISKGCPNLM